MIDETDLRIAQEKIYDSERLARIMVDHITNEKGQILARVWENPGFQEIYDYKGILKERKRLKRKAEQIHNQLDAKQMLFQKLYYNPNLLQEDEMKLRQIFVKYNDHHETANRATSWGFFLGYWPLTYAISRQVRAPTVFLWTAFYYFGLYRQGALHFTRNSLQKNLNRAAEPMAQQYGIKTSDQYVQ